MNLGALWRVAIFMGTCTLFSLGVQTGVASSQNSKASPTTAIKFDAATNPTSPILASSPTSAESIVGIANAGSTGYWEAATDGGVFSFNSTFYGSAGGLNLSAPIARITATGDYGGYWLVGADGGVFNYGDAPYDGSIPGVGGSGGPQTVGLVPDLSTGGYWEIDADGGVFSFNASFHGSLPGLSVSTLGVVDAGPYGTDGYCMLWNTGRADCFTSGGHSEPVGPVDSPFVNPAVAFSVASNGGIWVTTRTGTINSYGNVTNEGSLTSVPWGPIAAIAGSGTAGYRIVGADGGTFAFNMTYVDRTVVNSELSSAAAQHFGQILLPQGGWGTAAEWSPNALMALWNLEDGGSWQWDICYGGGLYPNCNYSGAAYGIPQANPGERMCDPGYDPSEPSCPVYNGSQRYAYQVNAWSQITWGFWYIGTDKLSEFHDPETAYQYDVSHGGYVPAS